MKIPPFWARGSHDAPVRGGPAHRFSAFGYSYESAEAAMADALARARRVADWFAQGREDRERLAHYDYGERPPREEILERLGDPAAPHALITRNRYGARVLNSERVMFVDVDFPPVRPQGMLETLCWSFMPGRREARRREVIAGCIARVKAWAAAHPAHGFRVYRTCAGLRLLFTTQQYDPAAPPTLAILRELDTDPLYLALTTRQACFRARLTPKPWRCACARPPVEFPWADAQAEGRFRDWERGYREAGAAFRVCDLLGTVGTLSDDAVIAEIIALHDRETGVAAKLPLA